MKTKDIKFEFDKKIIDGYYSASYFLKTQQIIKEFMPKQIVALQFVHFHDRPIVICGIEEVLQLLNFALTPKERKEITVYAKQDGDLASSDEAILIIKGPYQLFGYLENLIDGILARRSSVATNTHYTLSAAGDCNVIFMGERSDDYLLQKYDGYAAWVGGIRSFVTEAHAELIKQDKNVKVEGTIPHSLIQQHHGDLLEALKNYQKCFPGQPLVGLIDYHNDVIYDLEKIKPIFSQLSAVRIDTSIRMVDKSLQKMDPDWLNSTKLYGVNTTIMKLVREYLDNNNGKHIKIIASSGIDEARILKFKKHGAPIDLYGIGSSLIKPTVHFSGDLVAIDGSWEAKEGRSIKKNYNKLKKI